jgi:heterodisulfide reductase subunit B
MRWGEEHKAHINEVLAAAGLSYSANLEVLHPLTILVDFYGLERIQEKVINRLDGLKVAPYYGCQIVRPKGRFDDPEDPQQLDNLFAALGAEVVPFPVKVRCCGGMLMTSYEDVALKLNRDILSAAADAGADVIVTTCPLCQINLEAYQDRINQTFGTRFRVPVVYFTQLVGLALGLSAEELKLDEMVVPLPGAEARRIEVHA